MRGNGDLVRRVQRARKSPSHHRGSSRKSGNGRPPVTEANEGSKPDAGMVGTRSGARRGTSRPRIGRAAFDGVPS